VLCGAELLCLATIAPSNPICELPSNPLHPIRADPSNSSLKDISLHNRQAADAHNARLLQPGLLKIRVPFLNQLIESLDLLVQL
jgi:hypothetical protein